MSDCTFAVMTETMAILDAKLIDNVAPTACQDPAAFEAVVVQILAPGYKVEHAARVCIEHQKALNAMPGHWTSHRIRIR